MRLDDAEGRFEEALRLEREGSLHQATEVYRALLETSQAARSLNRLGVISARQGHPDEAEALFRQALEKDPGFAQALSNLGNALLEQGDDEGAEAWYRKAIAADADLAEPHQNLAAVLKRRQDVQGMVRELKAYQRIKRQEVTGPRGTKGSRSRSGCGLALMVVGACAAAATWIIHLA